MTAREIAEQIIAARNWRHGYTPFREQVEAIIAAALAAQQAEAREAAFKAGFGYGLNAIDKFGEQHSTADEDFAGWVRALSPTPEPKA